jgi:endonuclease/exonuclease/phosphatase family metal-dependent hydrolase
VVALLLVATAVIVYHLVGGSVRERLGLERPALPQDKGDALRLATWNLHNFPCDEQDTDAIARRILELDADVLAVQEVRDEEALVDLLPGREVHLSRAGGRGGQKLGLVLDPRTVELVAPPEEHAALAMGGRHRPALSARVRARTSGLDLFVVVVHLKAFPEGISIRREQWALLVDLVARLRHTDADVVVLGDFNTTGPPDGETEAEIAEVDIVLERAGLRRLDIAGECTAYWEGSRRDAWKEPSLIDQVFVAGVDRHGARRLRAAAQGMCARHACEAFRSTPAYPEPEFTRMSDHCAVVVDFATSSTGDAGAGTGG